MIVYYHKQTGEIVGTQGGRVHHPDELKMWVGTPEEIGRIIVEWKPKSYYKDKDGNMQPADWKPDTSEDMIPLFEQFERDPMKMHSHYKMDVNSLKIVPKPPEEIAQAEQAQQAEKQNAQLKRQNKINKMKLVADKTRPLEQRFNALLEILDIQGL